jgi:long-chain acyl-CoA synthetase
VVVGDKKPFIAALITLDPEMLPTWLKNNHQDASLTVEQASTNPAVLAEVQRAIDAANALVSRAESIRKFQILKVDLTEASGHLTPKLSIKRGVITEDFGREIEGIYSDAPATMGFSLK